MHWITMLCAAVALGFSPRAHAEEKPVRAHDLKDNVRVRLVAARTSETRGQNLIAKVETREEEPKTILIRFPAHGFTAHEQTLWAVIQSCVEWDKQDENGWSRVEAEAIFSMPKDGAKRETKPYSDLEKCYLVSLRLPTSK